jgi:hypothetical protein
VDSAPLSAQGLNEGKGKPFTAEDIRFTTKGDAIYAILLGKPTSTIRITSLGKRAGHFDGAVRTSNSSAPARSSGRKRRRPHRETSRASAQRSRAGAKNHNRLIRDSLRSRTSHGAAARGITSRAAPPLVEDRPWRTVQPPWAIPSPAWAPLSSTRARDNSPTIHNIMQLQAAVFG